MQFENTAILRLPINSRREKKKKKREKKWEEGLKRLTQLTLINYKRKYLSKHALPP